jgi:hypothetical protein
MIAGKGTIPPCIKSTQIQTPLNVACGMLVNPSVIKKEEDSLHERRIIRCDQGMPDVSAIAGMQGLDLAEVVFESYRCDRYKAGQANGIDRRVRIVLVHKSYGRGHCVSLAERRITSAPR